MRRHLLTAVGMVAALAACGDGTSTKHGDTASASRTVLAPLTALAETGAWRATGDDLFEVWICHVPVDSTAAIYGGLPLRLPLTPEGVAAIVEARVPKYFDMLSHGRYRPSFTAGGEVSLGTNDGPQSCVDQAVAGAGPDTRAVLVVADAEHAVDQPGGFGSGGDPCPDATPCPVAQTHRSAYVGASDFHPDWVDDPPMDLVEHEIGHTLGWVHSGVDAVGAYLSALDVMSNSAAPRDVDPARRDGPDTLAVNRLLAGWLTVDDVWVAPATGGKVTLSPSTGDDGTRLALVALGGGRFISAELLTADGLDAHLPTPGIAVHLITVTDGVLQPIEPRVGDPPYTALLQAGSSVVVEGWRVQAIAPGRVVFGQAG